MSLTKKDKEEIAKIVVDTVSNMQTVAKEITEGHRNLELEQLDKKWEYNGIKSESTGLIIAPEDVEIDGETAFTWDEAMALEKEGKIPEGWRLPTRHEWIMLIEEFGQDEGGAIDGSKLEKRLNLEDSYGYYWSSTAISSSQAYSLYFYSSSAYMNSSNKYYGFSVRCVKEEE